MRSAKPRELFEFITRIMYDEVYEFINTSYLYDNSEELLIEFISQCKFIAEDKDYPSNLLKKSTKDNYKYAPYQLKTTTGKTFLNLFMELYEHLDVIDGSRHRMLSSCNCREYIAIFTELLFWNIMNYFFKEDLEDYRTNGHFYLVCKTSFWDYSECPCCLKIKGTTKGRCEMNSETSKGTTKKRCKMDTESSQFKKIHLCPFGTLNACVDYEPDPFLNAKEFYARINHRPKRISLFDASPYSLDDVCGDHVPPKDSQLVDKYIYPQVFTAKKLFDYLVKHIYGTNTQMFNLDLLFDKYESIIDYFVRFCEVVKRNNVKYIIRMDSDPFVLPCVIYDAFLPVKLSVDIIKYLIFKRYDICASCFVSLVKFDQTIVWDIFMIYVKTDLMNYCLKKRITLRVSLGKGPKDSKYYQCPGCKNVDEIRNDKHVRLKCFCAARDDFISSSKQGAENKHWIYKPKQLIQFRIEGMFFGENVNEKDICMVKKVGEIECDPDQEKYVSRDDCLKENLKYYKRFSKMMGNCDSSEDDSDESSDDDSNESSKDDESNEMTEDESSESDLNDWSDDDSNETSEDGSSKSDLND